MLDTLFLFAAAIGGTIMVCQFLLTLMGLGDHGLDGDFGGGDADFGGDAHFGDMHVGDVGGDVHAGDGVHVDTVDGDHHNAWSDVDDVDTQHPDSTGIFAVLSFRTTIAAIAFFGLGGAIARSSGLNTGLSVVIAFAAGLAALYGTYYLLRSIVRLNSSGNEDIVNAIGQHATVYIPIPPARSGAGKVQFSMQNRIVEFPAVTDDPASLKTGAAVEVVAVNGNDTVEVRRIATTVEA